MANETYDYGKIVFSNGRWINSKTKKEVNSPFAQQSQFADGGRDSKVLPNYGENFNNLSLNNNLNQNSYVAPEMNDQRFTNYGNSQMLGGSGGRTATDFLQGDYFKNLNKTQNNGLSKYFNLDNANMLSSAATGIGAIWGAYNDKQTNDMARDQMAIDNKLDSANFYGRTTNYNDNAKAINAYLEAQGSKVKYSTVPTTYNS